MNDATVEKAVRWLSTTAFLLVLPVIAILLRTPPATGYEPSLYAAYPTYFWALVVLTILVGQLVILLEAYHPELRHGYWRYGFGAILVVNALLFFIPYFRGYAFYGGGDALTHIGFIRDIAMTGGVDTGNIYPSLHLLVLFVSHATGAEYMDIANAVPPVAGLVSIVSTFLLVREAFEDQTTVLFVLPFVAPPILTIAYLGLTPFGLSTLLFPFVLYLVAKERRTRFVSTKVALVLVLVGVIPYHPITSGFLLVVFSISAAVKRVNIISTKDLGSTNVAAITLVGLVAWYLHFTGILLRLKTIFGFLTSDGGETQLDTYSSTIARTSPRLIDLVKLGIYRYGLYAIFSGFALLYVATAVALYRRNKLEPNVYTAVFSGAFFLLLGISVVALFGDVIVGFGRPLIFAMWFGAILTGLLFALLYERLPERRWRPALKSALYVSLVFVVVLSTLTLYSDPHEASLNDQVTEMDLSGANWFFQYRNDRLLVVEFGFNQNRFADALYGKNPTADEQNPLPPSHFGYSDGEFLGDEYDRDAYLVLTERGRSSYPSKFPDYPQYWRYTPEDFARLERDSSVTQVYTNGEFDVYYVESPKSRFDSNA